MSDITCLAFSRGRWLISGSNDKTAILWDAGRLLAGSGVSPWLVHRLTGHLEAVTASCFTLDDAYALTGSDDHDLRLWRVADGAGIAVLSRHRDNVLSVTVAPDGSVASGDWEGAIRLWDLPGWAAGGCNGVPSIRMWASQGQAAAALSISPDGKWLLTGNGGNYFGSECHVYDLASGERRLTYDHHDNVVRATAISPDGRWAATAGGTNHEIHLWELATGVPRLMADGQPLRLAGQGNSVWAVGFAQDGRSIAWGYEGTNVVNMAMPLRHVLELPSVDVPLPRPATLTEPDASAFRRASTRHGAFALDHEIASPLGPASILNIRRDGAVVISIEAATNSEQYYSCYTFTPDGETVICGSFGKLIAYDRQGEKRANSDFIGHESVVLAVATSPDGRYLLSGSADQTVRLWNLKTREPLVTLFHGTDGEWVMSTPQGYYIASENGDSLIGWHINYGPELTPDYVESRQLARRLYRPDIIARTIELASATAALVELGAPANVIDSLRTARPPQFRFVRPTPNARVKSSPLALLLEFAPDLDPLEAVRITVNSRQIATRDVDKVLAGAAGPTRSYSVPLQQGHNDIHVVAVNRAGETPARVSVTYAGTGELDKRGVLYVVAVGVDHYEHYAEAKLRFAAKDARDFLAAMEEHCGPLYSRVESRLLIRGEVGGREPTAENIRRALRLFRRARERDTVALFLAGHGTSDLTDARFRLRNVFDRPTRQSDYLFLPQNAKVDGEGWDPNTVVTWTDIQPALHRALGLRLLFVDTCHAHGAYDPRLVQEAGAKQVVVFAATDRGLPAFEDPDFRNGTFTLALIQGLSGRAAQDDEGNIGLGALQQYVHDQVTSLSDGNQTPMFRNTGGRNFIIARRRGG